SSVDCVIISPVKLKDFREKIIANLEGVLNCSVSIKFKSGNGVYPESEMKGITSICVSNIDKI
ncbi:MAG: 2-C-methyl-D-erythritol 2,4-cyclodiphosphate synthase, partial [Fervidobacterium sp.]